MQTLLANPLLVALPTGRVAQIEWSFDWYPQGFAAYEARYKQIDWEALSRAAAYDLDNPAMRIEQPGQVDVITILDKSYDKQAATLTAAELTCLNEAARQISTQVSYARLCEIYS